MFWKFGGYATVSSIDTILDKPEFTLEEILDDHDLLDEIKQRNGKLIEYLHQGHILERLLDYVVAAKLPTVTVTEPDKTIEKEGARSRMLRLYRERSTSSTQMKSKREDEESEKKLNHYSLMSTEVLSSEIWSISGALTKYPHLIHGFWKFLKRDAPLDPLQASNFTKVNELLFEKETHEMKHLFMSMPGVVNDLLNHVECPMIMDLLLKIIAMERNVGGGGMIEVGPPVS